MTKSVSRGPDLLHGPVFSNMTRFFLPIMLGSLLQQLYSMVDAVVLGRLVGKTALAAVGGSDLVIINLVVGFFVGLSSGACVVVSQHYGAGEGDMVRKSVHTAILFSVVIGAVMTALGILMARPVLVLLDPPADTLADSIVYLQWYFAGMIPSMVYNMGAGILRAVGDSKRPLYFLIVCALANTGLDLLFVAVFGLGTAGAAMATSLSQLICAGLVIWVLLRIPGDCRLHMSELRFDSVLLRRMTAIGLPAGLATIMYSVANVIIQKAINLLGTDTAAAWSIYWKLDGFYWPVSNAIGITVMTFAGQNYGARQLDRITSVIRTGMWMHVGFSALFSALLFLTRGLTVRFFTDDTNVMAEGSRIITMLAFFYPTFCCVEVLSSAMRGCGRSVMPTVLTLFGTCLLRLALLFFVTFPHLSNWTIALYNGFKFQKKRLMFSSILNASHQQNADLVGINSGMKRSIVRTEGIGTLINANYTFGKNAIGVKFDGEWKYVNSHQEDFTNLNIWNYNYGLTANLNLPLHLQLSTDLTMFSRRGYHDSSLNTDDLVWNARLSYSTMKGNLIFMLDGYDILSQLSNITYTLNGQGRTEVRRNVLPQYVLFHVQYRLNKKPKR